MRASGKWYSNKVNSKMWCLQQSSHRHYTGNIPSSTSQGLCGQRRLLMAGAVFSAIFFVTIILFIAVNAVREDGCMGDLECLPISKCQGHINPDFIYGCGSHDSPKICCVVKKNDTEYQGQGNENEENLTTASRIAKMELLPKKCGIGETADKIANGINATLGQFPWMVILGYTDPKLPFVQKLCGGTIISNRYILTAAHCAHINQLNLSVVTLGEHNLATAKDCEKYDDDEEDFCADDPVDIPVQKIIVHEKFNKSSLKNDIALLRLDHNITAFTDYIKPVCLPFGLKIDETYFWTRNFTISGWGTTSASSIGVSSILQHTTVSAWRTDRCNEALQKPYSPVENRQVCATGPDFKEACRGDSGGPMTYNHVMEKDIRTTQLGIVSFKSFDTCGTVDVPTVFTRVDRYLDWILDNIEP